MAAIACYTIFFKRQICDSPIAEKLSHEILRPKFYACIIKSTIVHKTGCVLPELQNYSGYEIEFVIIAVAIF